MIDSGLGRAAAVAALASLAVVGTPALAPAGAAPESYTMTTCDPDTTDGTAPGKVTVHRGWFTGGRLVAIMDNTGAVNPYLASPPPASGEFHAAPLCVTRLGSDGKPTKPTWLFCLNRPLDACGEAPYKRAGGKGGRKPMSHTDRTRLAFVLNRLADYATRDTRGETAQFIWCVTEGLKGGAPVYDSKIYGSLRCPEWAKAGKELPPESPHFTITADRDWAPAGATAMFTLKTNIPKLKVTSKGLSGLKVCRPKKGAKLKGKVLTLSPGVHKVKLCGKRRTVGKGSVRVSQLGVVLPGLSFWVTAGSRTDCQGMVESAPRRKLRAGTATTRFAPRSLKGNAK